MSIKKIDLNDHFYPDLSDLQIVDYYSVKEELGIDNNSKKKIIKRDCSALKYYKEPGSFINFDLNVTIDQDNVNKKKEALNDLFEWITDNFSRVQKRDEISGAWIKPTFISVKGTINAIFSSPIAFHEGWTICAIKFLDIIYLCIYMPDKDKYRPTPIANKLKKCLIWDFKFEQYLLSDSPYTEPDPTKPLQTTDKFYCVFKSQFGRFNLLYMADLYGVMSDTKVETVEKNTEFVLIRTSNEFYCSPNNKKGFHKKYSIFWIQSYLSNIQNIVYGLRNENGIVQSIKKLKLGEIEDIIGNSEQYKKAAIQTLTFIYESVVKNYDECIYKFSLDKNENTTIHMEELSPSNEQYNFLPIGYIEKAINFENKY
ncbi:decapping and exoribonuclease protein-like [Prorops nasuta]|uniref:decapping and exoribonuclease protein-like n=1 Tax=Prorops nasuta TaxID=863751 RepID=UPI0034CFC761